MKKLPENTILKMDCIEGMRSLPDDFCNLIIADPPYSAVGRCSTSGSIAAMASAGTLASSFGSSL
jgi:DNA modification methylase